MPVSVDSYQVHAIPDGQQQGEAPSISSTMDEKLCKVRTMMSESISICKAEHLNEKQRMDMATRELAELCKMGVQSMEFNLKRNPNSTFSLKRSLNLSFSLTRDPNSSARIVVAVKNTKEVRLILKLLLLRIAQKEDHILFLHVTKDSETYIGQNSSEERSRSTMHSLDEVICDFVLRTKKPVPKVTISSLVVENPDVGDAIVEEARRIKATMIILGNSRMQFLSRSMHRIGKHCVKNLPSYCFVLVARRGKVLHVRSGSAKCKTLISLLQTQRKMEAVENEKSLESGSDNISECLETGSLSWSSCSMDTVLCTESFSSETMSSTSMSDISSPSSVLNHLQENSEYKLTNLLNTELQTPPEFETQVKQFEYEELLLATNDFANENLVGSGGCCNVYRGILSDGTVVAVKRLLDSTSGQREFSREIKVISYIRHRNLVTLTGFCTKDSHRLLVYHLLRNGSLQQHLHGRQVLSWKQRQKIALGAARGLQYLHDLAPYHVIHQDVKSSNILLTEDFEAQISDFGFARWSNELSSTCSGLLGTFGYMAPEYLVHGVANDKTDVHSFGVVLLELISGRPPIDPTLPTKKQSLVRWATSLERTGATHEMVDPRLNDIDPHEMRRMMYAALLCVRSVPEERPHMQRVVNILDSDFFCTEPLLSRHTFCEAIV